MSISKVSVLRCWLICTSSLPSRNRMKHISLPVHKSAGSNKIPCQLLQIKLGFFFSLSCYSKTPAVTQNRRRKREKGANRSVSDKNQRTNKKNKQNKDRITTSHIIYADMKQPFKASMKTSLKNFVHCCCIVLFFPSVPKSHFIAQPGILDDVKDAVSLDATTTTT